MRAALSLVLVVGLLASCADPRAAGRAGEPVPGTAAPVSGEVVALRIAGTNGVVSIRAEIAATGAARGRGLSERRALAEDAGMLFLYAETQAPDAGFWMYRTRIPLDIAFLDGAGRILAIRTMQPCPSAVALECPTFAPGMPYRAALEVNRGFFARHGIAVGDRVRLPEGMPVE